MLLFAFDLVVLILNQGYLSLAQANFQNRSTTHYGQDSYDERMQATRWV
jgi:hypothetical protein